MTERAKKTFDLQKIKEAFENMDYGQNVESTAKADHWLKSVSIVDQSAEISNIFQNIKLNPWDCKPKQKKSVLIKLAQEIENNADVLCQIEIQSRGILTKDTRRYLPLMADYIKFYANFVNCDSLYDISKLKTGIVVGIFDDNTPLWMLALVIGPALAAGYSIVLQTATKLAVATKFILELARKVGVPDQSFNLIFSNEGNLQTYLDNNNVQVLALFTDLLDSKYQGINKRLIKVLHFTSYNTPMIVFDSSDLDSAVESVIENAWGYQSMQPWSINKILIQENIFKQFTAKLKNKLLTVKIGNGNNKLADISFPSDPLIFTKLNNAVEKAKSLGVEIFQMQENSVNFTPTLLIGMNIETNNVINAPEKNGAVTLLAFRSIDEAVNLANNSRQGFGASVWTENIGLSNEVARKLDVNNVWINSHGLISVEAPLIPLKGSGNAYFGGKEGFYEYFYQPIDEVKSDVKKHIDPDSAVINAINSAKSASISWAKTSYIEKLKLLSCILDQIENSKQTSTDKLLSEYIDTYVNNLNVAMFKRPNHTYLSSYAGYDLNSTRTPRGVVVIKCGGNLAGESVLILSAILEGNAVVLLTGCVGKIIKENMYLELSKKLPSGLLSVLPCTNEAISSVVSHKGVSAYYNVSSVTDAHFRSLPIKDSKIYLEPIISWSDSFNKVTISKNIWSNIGQSITCNL